MIERGEPDARPEASAEWRVLPPRPLEVEDYLLLAAVFLLPWAFGGVEIWAYRSAALLLAAAGAAAIYKRRLQLSREDARLWVPAGLFVLWAAFQLVPLPPAAIRMLSPQTYRIYDASLPGYPGAMPKEPLGAAEASALAAVPEADVTPAPGEPEDALRVSAPACRPRWRPLSLEPTATQERLLWYVALLIGFLVVQRRAAEPGVYRQYRRALFVLFAALAVFALVQELYWNGKLYWIRPVLVQARPFGPYVNPNHFAGVMELAVPWMAAYAWTRARRDRARRGVARALVHFQLAAICLAAGLATHSVGGAVLLGASLTVLGVLAARTLRARVVLAGSMIAASCLVAWLVSRTQLGEEFLSYYERAEGEGLAGPRAVIWRASLRMLLDFPLMGSGFGSFREMFPRYMPPGADAVVAQAHCDYLEVLLSGGIVAGLLLLGLVWGFWSLIPHGLRRVGREGWSVSRLGLVLGIASLSVHGLFDFNHQIPANALLFVTACGLVMPHETGRPDGTRRTPGRREHLQLLLAALVLLLYAGRAVSGTVGGVALARAMVLNADRSYQRALPLLERAAVGSNRPRALREAAEARLKRWDRQARRRGTAGADERLLARSAEDYLNCLCTSPASWRPWAGLGDVYYRRDRQRRNSSETKPGVAATQAGTPWAHVGRSGRIAVGMIRNAIERAPNWYAAHDQLALTYWHYGLLTEARGAVRASAAAQPRFSRHRYAQPPDPPGWMLDAFAEGSWEALGRVPLLSETDHLLALGKLEWMRKDLGKAAGVLTMALELPGDAVRRAETSYYLGLVLLDARRYQQAKSYLLRAGRHPSFRGAAQKALSRLAMETEGDDAGP